MIQRSRVLGATLRRKLACRTAARLERARADAAAAEVPRRLPRLVVALVIGVIACLLTRKTVGDAFPVDAPYWFGAAYLLLRGENPYAEIGPGRIVDLQGAWAYPLPAALVTMPFLAIDPNWSAFVMVGCSFALCAYGLTGMPAGIAANSLGWWQLLALASAPATATFYNGQWAPALLGAALVPAFGWMLAVKPTLGAALWLWRPTKRAAIGVTALCLVSLPVLPSWPQDFLRVATSNFVVGQYVTPLFRPNGSGLILLLALLRWRRPESRLLVLLGCIPQNAFLYDQLPLLLVPRSRVALALFAIWTHVLWRLMDELHPFPEPMDVVAFSLAREPLAFWGLYVPCLVMVLLRRNEGSVPPWLERMLRAAPEWLRGTPSQSEVASDDTTCMRITKRSPDG